MSREGGNGRAGANPLAGAAQGVLREMLLIRRFEEQVEERLPGRRAPGFLHVAIGQEAVAVGVCGALEEGDVIASTHCAHGHTLAKGTHPNELKEEYGKVEGRRLRRLDAPLRHRARQPRRQRRRRRRPARHHRRRPRLQDARRAAGRRRLLRRRPTNIGTFHEALGLAQLWRTQSIFVCENNHYAESTPAEQQLPIRDLAERAKASG